MRYIVQFNSRYTILMYWCSRQNVVKHFDKYECASTVHFHFSIYFHGNTRHTQNHTNIYESTKTYFILLSFVLFQFPQNSSNYLKPFFLQLIAPWSILWESHSNFVELDVLDMNDSNDSNGIFSDLKKKNQKIKCLVRIKRTQQSFVYRKEFYAIKLMCVLIYIKIRR